MRFVEKRTYTYQDNYFFIVPEGKVTLKVSDFDRIMLLKIGTNPAKVICLEQLSNESVKFIEDYMQNRGST